MLPVGKIFEYVLGIEAKSFKLNFCVYLLIVGTPPVAISLEPNPGPPLIQ